MKTPLIFKLLLMIAVGLRLIYASKKTPKLEEKYDYLNLTNIDSSKLKVIDEKIEITQKIKKIYRQQVRQVNDSARSREMWMIAISHSLLKTFKKGNIFRFLWHKNEWVLGFYQTLESIGMITEARIFNKLIYEHCGNLLGGDIKDFFPDPSVDSPSLESFNAIFDLKLFCTKVLKYISQN